MNTEATLNNSKDNLKIFYDGDCPICEKEMAFLKRRDKKDKISLIDIANPDFNPASVNKTRDQLMSRIHALTPDGTVIEGVEVFRQAYSRVGLGWLLAATKLPVIKPIADLFYTWFARNRIRIGEIFFGRCTTGSCKIPK